MRSQSTGTVSMVKLSACHATDDGRMDSVQWLLILCIPKVEIVCKSNSCAPPKSTNRARHGRGRAAVCNDTRTIFCFPTRRQVLGNGRSDMNARIFDFRICLLL